MIGNMWIAPLIKQQKIDGETQYLFQAGSKITGLTFPTYYTMDALISISELDLSDHKIEIRLDKETISVNNLSQNALTDANILDGSLTIVITLRNFLLKESGIKKFSLYVDGQEMSVFRLNFSSTK
ncbi:hypothetical protein LDE05_08060 [Lactobacillus delbrueckii subsp. bulgaricus]|uniref:Uncharacterized protein n=1 Tax=Lactobacillus delbrueckii subsp. bulgaricus (strain ATCC 11842 / DSM 20081 / BCRC 10696 / JCM 1002 / NBRC 13953 / NCIMB 11778 / NCTC 12712 / WDCM 00102 / Lb 14) TaxID=390333 RepID=Q1G9J2_LACDA|nr:hypothetical protein [Lactobacillus delbrueckii]MBT8925961.1 hypothetical protein [Lactobacillus delbrueckii subsp. bulgaricus]MCD5463820.1 hypothetical protein [Lactobacillus delbrueckii subsp. bulgaricus]MCD5474258.1 hypothetical protein [Lactobacillus delbrueckii subsp. bulgaricus]MDG9747845.1 hypothetical protein [Lactobacillus delbrueckii subsp. bulgaricus ATCC 11842 = JCM 1002]CAI98196.1 Hypothetical protein Ldb1395 [Lactobacillus delbrueckii subsp. bulgaricus ATCC 11842 = JCM 1002]